jgi:hypothetical protein
MPNWKKLIVSGSDASLNSLTTPENVVNQLTASYALSAGTVAINSGTVVHITSASLTWDLVHNIGEAYPIVTIWDDTTNRIIQPDEIESVDVSTVKVYFTQPTTGYANISRAGHVLSGSAVTSSYALTASYLQGSVTSASSKCINCILLKWIIRNIFLCINSFLCRECINSKLLNRKCNCFICTNSII